MKTWACSVSIPFVSPSSVAQLPFSGVLAEHRFPGQVSSQERLKRHLELPNLSLLLEFSP